MKKKTIFVILISLVLIAGLFSLTGCGNNDTNSEVKSQTTSKEGLYELSELKSGDTKYTAKQWKDMTTMEYSLELKSDKTAIITMKYKKNMDGEDTKDLEYYTYDDEYFYGTNNNGTTERKKYFKYELKDGTLNLDVIDSVSGDTYIYKKK